MISTYSFSTRRISSGIDTIGAGLGAGRSQTTLEGKKVDRMVKHITKSEEKQGKSPEKAEEIGWATANKRGFLDNKNKKKKN